MLMIYFPGWYTNISDQTFKKIKMPKESTFSPIYLYEYFCFHTFLAGFGQLALYLG